jgi:hypothetical protein
VLQDFEQALLLVSRYLQAIGRSQLVLQGFEQVQLLLIYSFQVVGGSHLEVVPLG